MKITEINDLSMYPNGTIFYQSSAGKPRPSGRGCRGKKSDCLIYYIYIYRFFIQLLS